jgi:hypothetical protein
VKDPPPAEFLRRLRPIPTYRDHPATSPVDVEGVDPAGENVRVTLVGPVDPTLLLFLSASCLGCQDLWKGTAELRRSLPEDVRVVIVTRGFPHEDPVAIGVLSPPDILTVMSSQAYDDYRVGGPPFLVLVAGHEVRTEGVAWGVDETVRATRHGLGDTS